MLFDSPSGGSQPDIEKADGTASYVPPLPLVTLTLIAINLVVFMVMGVRGLPFVAPTGKQILSWGANYGPLTTSGQ